MLQSQILEKIETEVDLKDDVAISLKGSCDKLGSILKSLEKLTLSEKTSRGNIDLPFRIDRVINKHIPDIISNYLNFSIQYRNTQKIEYNGEKKTPKEIVLEQVSQVIKEVEEIEHDFYEVNKFALKAQGRYLEGKYGKAENIIKNNFNYDNYIDENKNKEVVFSNKLSTNNEHDQTIEYDDSDLIDDNVVVPNKETKTPNDLGEMFITIFFVIAMIIGLVNLFPNSDEQAKQLENQVTQNLNVAQKKTFSRVQEIRLRVDNKFENKEQALQFFESLNKENRSTSIDANNNLSNMSKVFLSEGGGSYYIAVSYNDLPNYYNNAQACSDLDGLAFLNEMGSLHYSKVSVAEIKDSNYFFEMIKSSQDKNVDLSNKKNFEGASISCEVNAANSKDISKDYMNFKSSIKTVIFRYEMKYAPIKLKN